MAKTMNEMLKELKGEKNVDAHLTGKGAFSGPGFAAFVNAMANDKSFTVDDFNASTGETEKVSIHDLVVGDMKKTVKNADYPQESEIDVLNDSKISLNGVSTAIPHIVQSWLHTGRKFPLPDQNDQSGYIYLVPVPGGTKEVATRDMKTQEPTGTTTIETQDHIQIRSKSSSPKHLTKKTRRDLNGNIIK